MRSCWDLDGRKFLNPVFLNLVVSCVSSHRMKFSCGVWEEPLVPHIRKGGRSPPGLIVSIPMEELGSFHKLRGIAVSSSGSAEVPNVPHWVNGRVTFIEDNKEWRGGDTLRQSLTVQILLCVKLHPVLQLLGDVLVPPLSEVGEDDARIKGACVSPHPQLPDSLLLEVQETYVVILISSTSNNALSRC